MYDIYNSLIVEDEIENGQVKKKNEITKKTSKSAGCTTTILAIIHTCSHGGGHTPGGTTTCDKPLVNDSYYEYFIMTTTCTSYPNVNYIAAPDAFAGQGGGNGGGSALTNNLDVQMFLYGLTEEEYAVIAANPKLISYLDQNNGSVDSREFAYWVIYNVLYNKEKFQPLLTFLNETNYITESISFVKFAIDFFQVNQNITWDQFENWFMGTPEGLDGEYDAAFWENPNLTFQQQNLPTLAAFKSAMPSKYTDAGTLCNSLGGDVLKMYNDVIAKGKKLNTCAIRVSTALIKCDVSIPFIPDNPNGSKNTVKDKDGNYLIINAKALNKWMRKTFGTNTANYRHFTAVQGGVKGGNFPQLMEDIGSDGIYSMVSRPEIHGTWGTGHADILEEGDCRIKCHFFDEKNNFVPVDYIDVWILK